MSLTPHAFLSLSLDVAQIAVNWLLLAFLYYVTMTEPTISESRRTNIFLVKGFVYLVLVRPGPACRSIFLLLSSV